MQSCVLIYPVTVGPTFKLFPTSYHPRVAGHDQTMLQMANVTGETGESVVCCVGYRCTLAKYGNKTLHTNKKQCKQLK